MTDHAAPDLRAPSRDVLPQDDRLNREAVVGAVTGLVVVRRDEVPIGGDLVLIQVSAFAGSGRVEVTGLHGPVLKDSVQTAYNIVRTHIKAAARAGRKLVLVPAENAKEVAQVPDEVLRQVEMVPVRTIQEALERVLEIQTPS